jgi:hypothetical protein
MIACAACPHHPTSILLSNTTTIVTAVDRRHDIVSERGRAGSAILTASVAERRDGVTGAVPAIVVTSS